MAIVEGWLPPTRANYELLLRFWQFGYPALGSLQWAIKWYGMGKTSTASRLNLPGRAAWLTMEAPGFLTLLYVMRTLPAQAGVAEVPWQHRVLAGLFVVHYLYRAVAFPLLQPSMAPVHAAVWAMALAFQLCNASCLGAWLAAYGPPAPVPAGQFAAGLAVFYAGLAGNMLHDEELRAIRRGAGPGAPRRYDVPQGGLFRFVLFPHYLCEWIEWLGFLAAAGWACAPARAFLVNEVCVMLPRAVRGRAWYVERFGEDRIRGRRAVIPGLV